MWDRPHNVHLLELGSISGVVQLRPGGQISGERKLSMSKTPLAEDLENTAKGNIIAQVYSLPGYRSKEA
jgi:hypothetical protein